MNLISRAEKVATFGTQADLFALLADSLVAASAESLAAVQFLAADDYGGLTMKAEFKNAAACCLFAWGERGLESLQEVQWNGNSFANQVMVIQLLAQAAGGAPLNLRMWLPRDLESLVVAKLLPTEELSPIAEKALNAAVLTIPNEDDAVSYVGHVLYLMAIYQGSLHNGPSRALIAALARRTLVVSVPVIEEYERLLTESRNDEPALQVFLEKHPLILDPLAVKVWPRPDFHGRKEPDFLVQRADGSYLIVEIETPGKGILTASDQIKSEVTHAVAQVLDYRSFLQSRFETASRTFPNFRVPDALVVIGLEGDLNPEQSAALRRENESRAHVQVIGFDALAVRARAMLTNLTRSRVCVEKIRLA